MKESSEINRKRVGVLGGTFDPPTKSHMAIARQAILSKAVDEVWV